jgi:hypothetical protein
LLFEKGVGDKTLKCKVCSRETDKVDFCTLHLKAYQSVIKNYDVWKKALGLSWEEYLSEIEKNSLTGEWAKEVAEYLIECEGARIVKKN